jgi:Zn-finger nucleic acid-binding protein
MTIDAGGLHCPNCGAAADPEAGRCPYCRARLATISCPACFTLGFVGAAFCHKCGTRRTRNASAAAPKPCPACRKELQGIDVGPLTISECGACDGVWVDADAFERLCAEQDAQAALLNRLKPRYATAAAAPVRYRPCVECGRMMNRVNFGRISGTVIDVCRGHGAFLDAGELHEIVSFVRQGGLERARTRRLDEIRDAEQRLKDLEQRARLEYGRADAPITRKAGFGEDGLASLLDMIRRNS